MSDIIGYIWGDHCINPDDLTIVRASRPRPWEMSRQEAINALYEFCEAAILTRSLEQERDYHTIELAFDALGVTEDELAVAQGNDGL